MKTTYILKQTNLSKTTYNMKQVEYISKQFMWLKLLIDVCYIIYHFDWLNIKS